MKIYAYLALLAMLAGGVLWLKSTIDAGWEAKLAQAQADQKKIEAAAQLKITKAERSVEKKYAEILRRAGKTNCSEVGLDDADIDLLHDAGLYVNTSSSYRVRSGTVPRSGTP